ncbi:Carboxylic ester hydrolase [Aphelenchoides besseyi]|nr:Carboxylic ester hydrolase [Aphelenchoides besseyi]KAI6199904.1 Carboxylic ester hydrolase [Aphelenchoides besseyi]
MRMGSCKSKTAPLVHLPYGDVKGKRLILANGQEINAFLGIPYAKQPQRFQKPELPDPWPEVLIAQKHRSRPIQREFFWDSYDVGVPVSEDCLHLNVIAPAHKNKSYPDGYAVLVFIHGGGFAMDSAAKYNYKKIARTLVCRDIIVVTFRLGYLGFFCLDDKYCKGNFGLFDQVMALRFVKEHIGVFGGNPNEITCSGQSAGSCSVDLLAISPLTRDLFDRVFLMAGFSENSWAITNKSVIVEFCRKKAIKLGFKRLHDSVEWTEEENVECINYLRTLPASCFAMSMIDSSVIDELSLKITPVLDDELLPRPLKQLRLETPPKTTMCGITKHEGLLFLALARRKADKRLLEYCEFRVGQIIDAVAERKDLHSNITLSAYRELYGINDSLRKNKRETQLTCVNILSDMINNIAIELHVRRNVNAGGVCYRYSFDHYNPTITTALNLMLPFCGATHGMELSYIFDINIFVTPYYRTKADRRVSNFMSKIIANFVKFGNPNGTGSTDEIDLNWKPATADNPSRHLCIRDNPIMKEEMDNTRALRLLPLLDAYTHPN